MISPWKAVGLLMVVFAFAGWLVDLTLSYPFTFS